MSFQASSHAPVELLSAYLDSQLVEPETRELEAHIDACDECHVRLESLRRVVSGLHRLERLEPSRELEKAVARRIALAGEEHGLLDRFENRLSIFNRQSSLLAMFAVVLALGIFIYLFAVAVEQSRTVLIPVVFQDPDAVTEADGPRELAGRVLEFRDEVWVEQGVSPEAATRSLHLDSQEGRALLSAYPELAELAELDGRAIIDLGGEVVEIQ